MRKLEGFDNERKGGVCMTSAGVLRVSHEKESQLLPCRNEWISEREAVLFNLAFLKDCFCECVSQNKTATVNVELSTPRNN